MSASWQGWRTFIKWRKHTRVLILKIFKRMDNRTVLKGVRQWKSFATHDKEEKVKLQRFAAKILNHAVNGALKSWMGYRIKRKRARFLIIKICRKLDNLLANKAVAQWKSFIVEFKRSIEDRRLMLAQRGVARSRMRNKITEQFQALIKATWAALRQIVNEARATKEKLVRLTSKWTGNSQKAFWGHWQQYRAVIKARKQAVGRSGVNIYRRAIARGFTTWVVHALEFKCAKFEDEVREKTDVLQQQTKVIVELSNFIFANFGLPTEAGGLTDLDGGAAEFADAVNRLPGGPHVRPPPLPSAHTRALSVAVNGLPGGMPGGPRDTRPPTPGSSYAGSPTFRG